MTGRNIRLDRTIVLALAMCLYATGCSHQPGPARSIPPTANPPPSVGASSPVRAHEDGSIGYAISWPQCGVALPNSPGRFAVIGVSNGRAFTVNPCLAEQYQWASATQSYVSFYLNTNFAPSAYPELRAELDAVCEGRSPGCTAYLYGFAEGDRAFDRVSAVGAQAPMWWLDVQAISSWSDDPNLNALSIRGAIDALRGRGVRVGISTTPAQWRDIVGDYAPGLPGWVAGAVDEADAAADCDGRKDFGGGRTEQIAFVENALEMVRACGDAPPPPGSAADSSPRTTAER